MENESSSIGNSNKLDEITQLFTKMGIYALTEYKNCLSTEYNNTMSKLFNELSEKVLEIISKNKDKDLKELVISSLESLPRQLGGHILPISLDLMFRSDGHSFSKLFHAFKKNNLQPFSLNINKVFVNTCLKFASTDEFKSITTFYLCSDEITGLSRHGSLIKEDNTYTGGHPFGGKRDKLTSMIASTLSANFSLEMGKLVDRKIFDEVCGQRKSLPTFDARVFPTNSKIVGEMFLSRILSCHRNTVSEFHDYFFGTKAGFGMSSTDKKKHMMTDYQYDFDKECPSCLKYGIFIKDGHVLVPTKIPKNDDKFVEFLYEKRFDDLKVSSDEFVSFEDMLKLYPEGNYIPETIRTEKNKQYEKNNQIAIEKKLLKEEKSKQYIRPDRDEVIRLRNEKMKLKHKKIEKQ